jgi:hypothetical protein
VEFLTDIGGNSTFQMMAIGASTTLNIDDVSVKRVNACGLMIDRTGGVEVIGGTIESAGAPVRLSSKPGVTAAVTQTTLLALSMENPGNNPYISVGLGWTGGVAGAGQNISIKNCSGSASGTLQQDHAVWLKDCYEAHLEGNMFLQPGTPVAAHWLEGTGNLGVYIDPCRMLAGLAYPWVMANGVHRTDACAHIEFNSLETTRPFNVNSQKLLTGANPSILISGAGGYYSTYFASNGATPTNLTTATGGWLNTRIRIHGPGNTTIIHGTGANAFQTRAGANIVLTALPTTWWHDGHHWYEE